MVRTGTLWRALGCLIASAPLAGSAAASTTAAVFGIVDTVTFEPSERAPERIRLTGVFVVPVPVSSGLHQPARRGELYFSVNAEHTEAVLRDWRDLEALAGTGRVVGFGQYWALARHPTPPQEITNTSFELHVHGIGAAARAVPYPVPVEGGVLTLFESPQDLEPRYGAPTREIVAELEQAHAP